MKRLIALCLSLSVGVSAQQTGWLTRIGPDYAELRTSQGLVQFGVSSSQSANLISRGLGSQWKVFLGQQASLDSAEFLGSDTSVQDCLRQLDLLIAALDAQQWDSVSKFLSTSARVHYADGEVRDYWHVHWLSPELMDRKLVEFSDGRCVILVAGKGVSFGRYGNQAVSPHRLTFVKEGNWKIDSYKQVGQAEWDR
jgi:hypothetical protein